MLAFSQQSADLGFVLGFPLLGAITGISASIVGLLLPSLLNGETATGQLQTAMEALRETAVTTESGITLLSAGIEKLAKKSAAAAAIEIELAMKQATAAIENARESIRDAADEWAGFGQGTALLNQQFFIAESAAKRLGKTIEEIVTGAAVESGGALAGIFGLDEAGGLRDAVASTAKEFKISKESALEYLRTLNEFKNRQITFEEFAETILKVSKENDKTSDSFNTLAQVTADATANAAEAADIQKVLALASKDLDKALKESSEGGFKAQEKAANDLSNALDRMFDAEIRASDAQEAREKRQALSLAGTTIARGMSPIERLELEHEELNQLKAKFTEDDALFQEALTANEAQQAEIRQAIALKERKGKQQAQQATQDFILGSVTAITSGIMASTDEQSAAFKAAFLIEKAVAIASILVNTELAAAKVLAHDAGILGLGAIATASIVRGIGFASAAFVGAQAISGAREHGGPVSAGKSFLVGERGPEIFTPGAGGNVTSNKESFGGTTLNVLVKNNTPSQVSTQMSDDGKQLKIVINEISNQIRTNQGPIPKALRSSTNTTFKASR
jgi:hypothetical protein